MPIISEYWEDLTEKQWQNLAKKYLLEIRGNAGKEYDEGNNKYGLIVTDLSFSASPELQWKFILLALLFAETDEELADIAAGQIEHLLGWHGEKYIDLVEKEAKENPKFAKALTGVWKYMMTGEIWARVQNLQSEAKEKLR